MRIRTKINFFILGIFLFFNRGVMSDQSNDLLSLQWVAIQDKAAGLTADFPHHPLEMTFDIPFQNTPPTGQVHVYSVPTQKGLICLSTCTSPSLKDAQLTKEELLQFFENVLVPHFFFNPAVFQDKQTYNFQPTKYEGLDAATFQFTFLDHGVKKKLEGIALIKKNILIIPFYLASGNDFDAKVLDRFLKSFRLKTRV